MSGGLIKVALSKVWADAIAGKIVEEGVRQCKTVRGGKVNGFKPA